MSDGRANASAAEIAIHVGAHKTATTHLQHFLELGRPQLEQQGVAWFDPEQIRPFFRRWRKGLLRRFFPEATYTAGLAALVRPALRSGRRVVVSEENLLGYCRHIFEDRSLYRSARPQIEEVAQAFRGSRIVVYLAVRDYAGFYPSAFGENLRDGGVASFDECREALLADARGWVEVVEDICAVVGDENIRLWRHEDYRDRHDVVAHALTGARLSVPPEPKGALVREGMSQIAAAKIEALARTEPWSSLKRLVPEIEAAYPRSAFPPFDPLTQAEKEELSARYQRDVDLLRKRLPGAWILQPTDRD